MTLIQRQHDESRVHPKQSNVWERLPAMPRRQPGLGTLVFLPGGGCEGTSGRPLHSDQLLWVLMRVVEQQQVLDGPLFNLRERQQKLCRGGGE